MKLSLTSGVGLTIKEEDFKPFWTSACKETSDKLWLPTKTDCVDLDSTLSNTLSTRLVENSWFSTTLKVPLKKKWSLTLPPSFTYSVVDSMDSGVIKKKSKTPLKKTPKCKHKECLKSVQEQTNKFFCESHYNLIKDSKICNAINAKGKKCAYKTKLNGFCGHHFIKEQEVPDKLIVNNCRLVRIRTTPKQFNVYRRIFGVGRKIYNACLIEPNPEGLNGYEFRDFITKKYDKLHKYVKDVPSKIKQTAVNDFQTAKDNAIDKGKEEHKWQTLHPRCRKDASQSISINKDAIKIISKRTLYLYVESIGKFFDNSTDSLLHVDEDLPDVITSDCRLVIKHDKYIYLAIPLHNESIDSPAIFDTVALDPGERCFQTFYSPEIHGSLGDRPIKRVIKPLLESDRIKSKKTKLQTKFKNSKGKERMKLRKHIKKLHSKFLSAITKPSRLIKELHYKTALFLVKNFDTILIPEFSSKKVSEHLQPLVNRSFQVLSHYTFRKRLIDKAKQWKRNVHIVPEDYTSKTCTRCGTLGKQKDSNKMLYCRCCDEFMDRDLRGARNIYIKTSEIFKQIPTS